MTCIVGLVEGGKVYMASDSLVSNHSYKGEHAVKLFRVGGGKIVVAAAGSVRAAQLMRYSLDVPAQADDVEDEKYLATAFVDAVRELLKSSGHAAVWENVENSNNGFFLIGYRGALYTMLPDYQITEQRDGVAALGSGSEYALGSLFSTRLLGPLERVRTAVEAAIQYNPYCGGDVNIEVLDS